MSITLSAEDLARTATVTETLLSPLRYPALDAWREAVCRATKELLGADMATFRLPCAHGAPYVTDGFDPAVLAGYPERIEALPAQVGAGRGFSYWERMARMGVWDRKRLQAPHLDEYLRSPYYNEFIVPIRAYDALGVTIALDASGTAAGTADLTFHHDRPDSTPFGERGVVLLRLLRPAFRAGVETWRALDRRWRELAWIVDTVSDGLRVQDAGGRILHANAGLSRILEAEPPAGRRALSERMDALAISLLAAGTTGAVPDPVGHRVRTPRGTYRIEASYVGDAGAAGPGVVVVVRPDRPELPDPERLRERFGLTRRQAEVALLLADHKMNEEIAEALSISPHTARHHTESVLRKLDIHSRRDVETAIRAATSENGDGRAS